MSNSRYDKSKFREALERSLIVQNIVVDEKRILSALEKAARHIKLRDGGLHWDIDLDLGNAQYYYNEYKQKKTSNREVRKDINRQLKHRR